MYGDRDPLYERGRGGGMSTSCGSHFNRQDDRPNEKMTRYTYSKTHGPQRLAGIEATQEARQERMIGGKRKGWNAGSRDSDDYKTTIDTLTRAINSKEESKQVPRNRAALPQ